MSKMQAELIIFGGAELEPDRLQSVIGLAPDTISRIGDRIGSSIRKYDSNSWIVSTGYMQCLSLAECIAPLWARLEPFWDKLRPAVPAGVDIQLSVAAYVSDTMPELNLGSEVISRLAQLKASVDIDIITIEIGDKKSEKSEIGDRKSGKSGKSGTEIGDRKSGTRKSGTGNRGNRGQGNRGQTGRFLIF